MNPRRRRAPLSDLSNLSPTPPSPSPSPSPSGTSTFPSSAQKLFRSKTINADNVLQQKAPSASHPELSSDGGAQDAATTVSPFCRTPLPAAMEVDSCLATPRAMETDEPASFSPKEKSFVTYSRRKSAALSHHTMSCPPPRHHLSERNVLEPSNRRRAVKRGLSAATFDEGGPVKGVPSRSRRHSLPNLQPKQWLPEEFVEAQRSHFAEVDAFELPEEEGELSDEG